MTTQSMEESRSMAKPDKLVRWALVGNALFSPLCALVLLIDAGGMAALLGAHIAVPIVVGVGLLPFAWVVLRAARRIAINSTEVKIITFMDAAWVTVSALLLLAGWRAPTAAGTWTVVLVADMVAIFGVLQWWGLRRVRREGV